MNWSGRPVEAEVPLTGGDVTVGVVRIRDTVRRPVGPHSSLVHEVLRHLEAVGFDGAPRFLGIDDQGREVLSYVEGEVAARPWPAWLSDESRMISVARLVRAYDDAVVGLGLPAGLAAVASPPDLPVPPPPDPPELIGHLDVTPENVVFRDGEAVALIDFDLAKPATRLDEMYNVMLWWAPLADPVDRRLPMAHVDPARRCRLLADAYGMSTRDRARLVTVAGLRTERSWYVMKHAAETRGGGWRRMWDEGVGDVIRRRAAWLEEHGPEIHRSLVG